MEDVTTPRLVTARLSRISAETGPGAKLAQSGKLDVEVSGGLSGSKGSPQRAVAKVTVAIRGIPEKAKSESDFAFRIETEFQGLYEWPDTTSVPDLKDKALTKVLTSALCQPLYVLAVAEIGGVVSRMGVGNVQLPWTFGDGEQYLAPAKKPASVRRTSRKAPANKKTAG